MTRRGTPLEVVADPRVRLDRGKDRPRFHRTQGWERKRFPLSLMAPPHVMLLGSRRLFAGEVQGGGSGSSGCMDEAWRQGSNVVVPTADCQVRRMWMLNVMRSEAPGGPKNLIIWLLSGELAPRRGGRQHSPIQCAQHQYKTFMIVPVAFGNSELLISLGHS